MIGEASHMKKKDKVGDVVVLVEYDRKWRCCKRRLASVWTKLSKDEDGVSEQSEDDAVVLRFSLDDDE